MHPVAFEGSFGGDRDLYARYLRSVNAANLARAVVGAECAGSGGDDLVGGDVVHLPRSVLGSAEFLRCFHAVAAGDVFVAPPVDRLLGYGGSACPLGRGRVGTGLVEDRAGGFLGLAEEASGCGGVGAVDAAADAVPGASGVVTFDLSSGGFVYPGSATRLCESVCESGEHTGLREEGEKSKKKGSGCARGPRWERNHGKKMRRKERKMQEKDWRAAASSQVVEDGGIEAGLRESSAAKWKAQNLLAAEKARRELAVLEANDVESEIRRYRAKVTAATERQLVSIETTHAKLAASGDLPGGVGSVETVVTGDVPSLSSGTISPNSSVSMAEYWAVKKRLDVAEEKLQLVHKKFGVNPDFLELCDKEIWTENTANEAILGEMYPDGYGMDASYTEEGKFRLIPC